MNFLAGKCSEAELLEINAFIKESEENARQFFLLEELYHLGKMPEAEQQQIEQAEKTLFAQIRAEEQKSSRTRFSLRWGKYAAVLCAILLMAGGLIYWNNFRGTAQDMIVETISEEVKELLLPDGTKVWLNNGTIFKYPAHFSQHTREVFIDGEGYFEVAKNEKKPFIVQSDAIQVRVLGTVFNIKSQELSQVVEATLIEGEVEVKGKRNEGSIVLSPGQRAELNRNTGRMMVKQVNARMDGVWRNDMIPFDQADLFSIAQTLEQFYNVKIILSPNIRSDVTYSGVLKKQKSIKSVLNSLKNSIPIDYKIVGNNIFISPIEESH